MSTKAHRFIVAIVLFSSLISLAWQMKPHEKKKGHYNPHISNRGAQLDSLFEGSNLMFASSGKCDHCHGHDNAAIASVDAGGNDINLVDDWSSTMMANSAKDPFWRAKVSHEVFMNPQLQVEIESTCTRCHSPLGRFAALNNGQETYSIEEMLLDSVALDGVSCLACHRQVPQGEVAKHTGQLSFHPDSLVAYGPYISPLITPMALYSGYTPEHGSHISDAKLCAGCHSLVTETVDLSGALTGTEFVEQATWHEWLNSSYPANDTTCQTCHLPRLEKGGVQLAAGYQTPPRTPFGLHTLAGGNSLMLALMRDNSTQLGIVASESQFNETIENTLIQLQQRSLNLQVQALDRTADTVYVDVRLKNLAGHKLPSGYPARRMSVHVVMRDQEGNELWRSGSFDPDFYIPGENIPFEPHYDVITEQDQIQIYEMAMGDVEGNRTTVLLRGHSHLKDNRLIPKGFTNSNPQYDTTEIVLAGVNDLDFNMGPNEGSGTDVVHYHIPTNGYNSPISIATEVYYQSVPPLFLEDMQTIDTPEIASFFEMFNAADRSPVLMRSVLTDFPAFVGIDEHKDQWIRFISGVGSSRWTFDSKEPINIKVYDSSGNLVRKERFGSGFNSVENTLASGMYIIVIEGKTNHLKVEKVIVR